MALQIPIFKKQYMILAILYIGYTLCYMDKLLVGILMIPIGTEFSLSSQQIGVVFSMFFLSYSLMQPIVGYLNDRISPKIIVIIAAFLIGISALIFGMATSFVLIIIARGMAGIFHGGYPTTCTKIIVNTFELNQRTFAQSILLSSAGIAVIITPIAGVFLIEQFTWRGMLVILGIAFILVSIIIGIFVKKSTADTFIKKQENHKILVKILLHKDIIVIFLGLFFVNIVLYGILSWIPKFLYEVKNFDLEEVGTILSLSGFGGAIIAVLGGYFVGKFMENKEKIIVFISTIICAIIIYYVYYATSVTLITLSFFAIFLMGQLTFLVIVTLPLKRVSREILGTVAGIVNTGGTLGGFISAIMIGKILETTKSYEIVFLFLSVIMLLVGIVFLLFTNKKGLLSI